MTKDQLLTELQTKTEMDPYKHDGSYELVQNIIGSYASMDSFDELDYKDLNAVYLMAIGTWKQNPQKKKETVKSSHLPENKKVKLCNLIDIIWDSACLKKYENCINYDNPSKPAFGMFGTGFYTFEGKTTPEYVKAFIGALVDIKDMESDEAMYKRLDTVLTMDFKGMRAASASVILHCFKPFSFPIMNGNMGFDNIFTALGVQLNHPERLDTYIENCRRIKEFRDANLPFKNYRILDIEAWTLGKAAEEKYYPKLSEYDPGISTEKYMEILSNEALIKKDTLDILYLMYQMGGIASCKMLAAKYGLEPQHYNANATLIAQTVKNETGCPASYRDNGKERYWPILFQGRDGDGEETGQFIWKMRDPLFQAISLMDEKGFFGISNKGEFPLNLILYGPPGTGKTFNTVNYAVAICTGKTLGEVSSRPYEENMETYHDLLSQKRIAFTTFHQSYGYEEFIEGIKPVLDGGNSLGYMREDGVFKAFCKKNENRSIQTVSGAVPCVFIIDEINRGNISKIFGELITLIEDTKRKGMPEETSAILPYSKEPFSVPSNVFILGTMNTADRSIALMDTALRRRFQFVEMMPQPSLLDGVVVDGLNIGKMLTTINERITCLYDREHTIGHAYFISLAKNPSMKVLAAIFKNAVIPLLQEYFYEDYAKIQLVLGDNGKTDPTHKFIMDEEIKPQNVFKGTVDEFDLSSEKKYWINDTAFEIIESYLEIM